KNINFSITPQDYLEASNAGKILYVYHSHTTEEYKNFSDFDKINSVNHNIPYILYHIPSDTFSFFNDKELNSTEIVNKLAKIDANFTISSKDLAEALFRVGDSTKNTEISFDSLLKIISKSQNSISQSQNTVVNQSDKKDLPMKITKISDLTDVNLKEAKASDVTEFYDAEIKKISDKYVEDKNKVDNELKAAQTKSSELETKYNETSEKLTKVQEDLNKLVKAATEKGQEDKFTARMTYFDNEFDLDEKTRSVVGNQIKNVSDKDYEVIKENLETLLAAKKKNGKVFDKKTMKWVDPKEVEEEKEEKKETKASVKT
ncbi:MAG: hypothetical protein AABY22_08455, partial [Nanoarchaeota archaeon]